jgi:hypothetical protein
MLGPPSLNFEGDCFAISLAAGAVVAGGVSYIFNTSDEFVGVSGSFGLGEGISFFGQYSHTWICQAAN